MKRIDVGCGVVALDLVSKSMFSASPFILNGPAEYWKPFETSNIRPTFRLHTMY